ncbi:hypothetical protein WNY37_00030 [Henriciella sp. AS95]|uniref:hypothetical protein n=1 Tax=Henriciella sp. AS95 TaxID=3135782 RepID=UPI00317633AB
MTTESKFAASMSQIVSDNPTADISCLQMEAVHEQVVAGFFRSFAELGLTCNAHFNRRILKQNGDLFQLLSYPGVHVDYPVMEGAHCWKAIASRVVDEDPKFIFMNTLQREGIAKWIEQFDRDVVGVIHNPKLFAASEACIQLAESGRLTAFCLAPYVVDKLKDAVPSLRDRAHVHYAYEVLPPGVDEYESDPGVLNILIPGAVNYSNRGFEGLIDTLRKTHSNLPRPVKFTIAAGGPDRARLEQDIKDHDLDACFDLMPLDARSGRVPYRLYVQCLSRCHAIMPLLPQGRQDYLHQKVTSGVLAGIGAARPMICPENVGEAYGFEPVLVPSDRPFDVSEADLSSETLQDRRQKLLRIRERGLEHNTNTLRETLSRR